MPRPATAQRPAPVVVGNAVLCVPHGFNNPVNYIDQDGHCPQPSGEWADANIICVAGFIPTKTSTAWDIGTFERFFVGDNRDFSSNSALEASRFWVWINADTWEIVQSYVHPTQRAAEANGDPIGEPYSPRNEPAEGWFRSWFQSSNSLEVQLNDDGSIAFNYSVVCSDPACNRFLAPEGSIVFTPNGSGSYDVSGRVNRFPNLEAYHWQNGELQGDSLLQLQNFSPEEIQAGNANASTSFGMALSTDLGELSEP